MVNFEAALRSDELFNLTLKRGSIISATSTSGNMQFNGGGTGNTTEEDCGNRGTGGGAGGVGKLRANSIMTQESSFSASKMSVQSHKESVFMPDFTVTATSNLVIFKVRFVALSDGLMSIVFTLFSQVAVTAE